MSKRYRPDVVTSFAGFTYLDRILSDEEREARQRDREERARDIAERRAAGQTYPEIAKAWGISKQRVAQILKAMSV